jgi:hypothetical protein
LEVRQVGFLGGSEFSGVGGRGITLFEIKEFSLEVLCWMEVVGGGKLFLEEICLVFITFSFFFFFFSFSFSFGLAQLQGVAYRGRQG